MKLSLFLILTVSLSTVKVAYSAPHDRQTSVSGAEDKSRKSREQPTVEGTKQFNFGDSEKFQKGFLTGVEGFAAENLPVPSFQLPQIIYLDNDGAGTKEDLSVDLSNAHFTKALSDWSEPKEDGFIAEPGQWKTPQLIVDGRKNFEKEDTNPYEEEAEESESRNIHAGAVFHGQEFKKWVPEALLLKTEELPPDLLENAKDATIISPQWKETPEGVYLDVGNAHLKIIESKFESPKPELEADQEVEKILENIERKKKKNKKLRKYPKEDNSINDDDRSKFTENTKIFKNETIEDSHVVHDYSEYFTKPPPAQENDVNAIGDGSDRFSQIKLSHFSTPSHHKKRQEVKPGKEKSSEDSKKVSRHSKDKDKAFDESQRQSHHSSHHESGNSGYKNNDDVSSKSLKAHLNEGHQERYSDKGKEKSKHKDEAKILSQHEVSDKGVKSEKFLEQEGHKKGHKTRGYNNRFHKDEVIREHKFYGDKDDFHFHNTREHTVKKLAVANTPQLQPVQQPRRYQIPVYNTLGNLMNYVNNQRSQNLAPPNRLRNLNPQPRPIYHRPVITRRQINRRVSRAPRRGSRIIIYTRGK